jgi:hypothetical protein
MTVRCEILKQVQDDKGWIQHDKGWVQDYKIWIIEGLTQLALANA